MAKNRSIEQKIRKMARKNRHAVFSGATTKCVERMDTGKFEMVATVDKGKVSLKSSGKHVAIPVGPISLSKAVMSTGRGPDAVRMQEYYQRIHSFDTALPETIGAVSIDKVTSGRRSEGGKLRLKDLENTYADFIKGVPKEHHISYLDDEFARLDLFFSGNQFFWVEMNYQKKFCRRSAVYSSKVIAEAFMNTDTITWVETI